MAHVICPAVEQLDATLLVDKYFLARVLESVSSKIRHTPSMHNTLPTYPTSKKLISNQEPRANQQCKVRSVKDSKEKPFCTNPKLIQKRSPPMQPMMQLVLLCSSLTQFTWVGAQGHGHNFRKIVATPHQQSEWHRRLQAEGYQDTPPERSCSMESSMQYEAAANPVSQPYCACFPNATML